MSRTFKDSLAYDAENAVLNANEFAFEATHRIKGDANNTESVTLIADWDMVQESKGGVNQAEDRGGQRNNQDVVVDLLSSVTVYPEQCQFVVDGFVLTAVKCIGRDLEGGMQTILCRFAKGITTRQARSHD